MSTKKNQIISKKDIFKFLSILIKNWYFIILFPIITFIITYLSTHRIPDIYAAKTQIMLKSNEVYDYQEQLYRGLGFNSKYASYEETASQMRVLTSVDLLNEVLDRLDLNVSYFIVGRLKVTEVYDHVPFKVKVNKHSIGEAIRSFDLKVITEEEFELTYSNTDGESKSIHSRFDSLILEDKLYLSIQKQPNLNSLTIGTLGKINYQFKIYPRDYLIRNYKANIQVENIDYTSIVEITLKDKIYQRAVEVLDTLSALFVENTVSNQRSVNENTEAYIDKQILEVTEIIETIENELQVFKNDQAILNLTKEEESSFNQLVVLEKERRTIEEEINALDELTSYFLSSNNEDILLPPDFFFSAANSQIQEKLKSLFELRGEYNSYLEIGTKVNPKVQLLLDKIEMLTRDLLLYSYNRSEVLKKHKLEVDREIGVNELKIKSIPKNQRQILNIERRLAVNEELYSFLLAKRAETIIAKAGLVPETKVIEKSRSIGVVYPDKKRLNFLGLLIGFVLAGVVILVKEMFFSTISSLNELKMSTSMAIVGGIPYQKDLASDFMIMSGSDKSAIAQSFRAIRANLRYIGFGSEGKTQIILLTSLFPGEGKTFTTVNLACILALAGKKVLIMDYDLHRPRIHKAMQITNETGVSNLLTGQIDSIEQSIKTTSIEGLHVITAGPVPPNASELIMRAEVDTIIESVKPRYDFILIDTPPFTLLSDAKILMQKVDLKLFVLNSAKASKSSVEFLEDFVHENGISDYGLILNAERKTRLNMYYSNYGYSYYNYGSYYGE